MTERVAGDLLSLTLHWEGGRLVRIDLDRAEGESGSSSLTDHGRAVEAALLRYESGQPARWPDLPFDFSGMSPFQQAAVKALRTIPTGTTLTYGELAEKLGRPGGAQAVGKAMGANPFPLIYPCHRVVGAGGAMTGFSAAGGVGLKERLLRLEGAVQPLLPGLDD